MANVLDTIVATTELDAVNQMLAAIGTAKLDVGTDLSTVTNADVVTAVDILKRTCRELCSEPWRFNTEFNYPIAPANAAFVWSEFDATSKTLAVFTPPTDLAFFLPSIRPDQTGLQKLDTTIRTSRQYMVASAKVPVFYDRIHNRDGFENRTYLYLDTVWFRPFSDMPESARKYIVTAAARAFAQSVVGSQELSVFTQDDLARAYRTFKRSEGEEDDYNIFDNSDVSGFLGERPNVQPNSIFTLRQALGLL